MPDLELVARQCHTPNIGDLLLTTRRQNPNHDGSFFGQAMTLKFAATP